MCAEKATVTIKNCTLTGNTAGNYGGGIVINGSKNNTIENCTFKGNTAKNGGAVCAGKSGGSPSTVTISGGTIGGTGGNDGNTAKADDLDHFGEGGGIFINTGCAVTLKDNVQVIGNTAEGNGGGVCTFGGKITMESGAIQSNKASKNGGGVAVLLSSGEFTMKGGAIGGDGDDKNKADNGGGGVYVYGAKFTMKDSAKVDTNNDVYLAAEAGGDVAKITVDNGLTGTAPVARITVPNDKYDPSTQVLTGDAVNTEHTKFTVTPQTAPSQNWKVGNNGYLQTAP